METPSLSSSSGSEQSATPSKEKKEGKSRKKSREKQLGSFIVENEPKPAVEKPTESLWSSLLRKEQTEADHEKIDEPLLGRKAEAKSETDDLLDEEEWLKITPEESEELTRNWAEARHQAIVSEASEEEADDELVRAQASIAEAFTAALIKDPDIEAATEKVERDFAVHSATPVSAEVAQAPLEAALDIADETSEDEAPAEIDFTAEHEGEIKLNAVNAKDEEEAIAPPALPGPLSSAPSLPSAEEGGGDAGHGNDDDSGRLPPPSPSPPGGGGNVYNNPLFIAGGGSAAGPNVMTAPDNMPTLNAAYYERHGMNQGLLVGGIVGYLIGRRQGRIKTEKKLLPVQKKLEREVKGLHAHLFDREMELRRAVARQAEMLPQATAVAAEKPRKSVSVPKVLIKPERPMLEKMPERRNAPEARSLHIPDSPPESIGRLIVAAEQTIPKKEVPSARKLPEALPVPIKVTKSTAEQQPKNLTIEKERFVSAEKQALTMSRRELMEISEKIVVDGASLHQVYETHLVSERGLRRLVGEYLGGGDIKRALRRELIEREIDFERDPQLRDKVRADLSGGRKSVLTNLLQQAGAITTLDDGVPAESTSIAAASKAAASPPVTTPEEVSHKAQTEPPKRITDGVMALIIIVLLALIIYFGFIHS